MARQTVRFVAVETVRKPAMVKFRTKSGETVSFKALRTAEKKELVHRRAKGK